MRAASYSFPPTNCLPAPPSVICSEIILTVPYMGLGALELKLMGKYPFHLTQKMNARLRAMPRSHRQTGNIGLEDVVTFSVSCQPSSWTSASSQGEGLVCVGKWQEGSWDNVNQCQPHGGLY